MRALRSTRRTAPLAVVLLTALAATACGSGDSGEEGGAKGEDFEGRGPITYVQNKDNSGNVQKQLDRWNKNHPDEKVTFIELPAAPDDQRQQMIQNAETKSDAYTVLSLDAVWTSEFAANRWIDELPAEEFPLDDLLKPAVETGKYRGRFYALPKTSDGGLLYYRTDLLEKAGVEEPPKTWAQMRKDCEKVLALPGTKDMRCYTGQFDKYEGLTVNFAEAVESSGGQIADENGKPTVDTPEARKGLDFLADSFRDGTIAKEDITYKEEEARRAFHKGETVFMRQWPYAHQLLSKAKDAPGNKFDVAPLPGLDGPGTSSLGGHNLALAKNAKNKATALDFIKFFGNEASAKANLKDASQAPAYTSLYDDPALQKQYPYLPELKESILHAVPRPRIVRYGDATLAIQEEVYAVLNGKKDSGKALKDLQAKLGKLSDPGQ